MSDKRKRCPNFSIEEKNRLVKLVCSHKDPILNKKTDSITNEAKNNAWEKITLDFNSAATVYNLHRNKDSLIKLWEKMKSESKRCHHLQRNGTTATDSGMSYLKIESPSKQVCTLLGRACTAISEVPESRSKLENKCPEISEEPTNGSLILTVFEEESGDENDNEYVVVNDDLKDRNQVWIEEKNTPKPPSLSRRHPELARTNQRKEAVSSICNSFINVNNKRKDIEELKQEMLEEEMSFKRKMYKLQLKTHLYQLQAAAKEVEIKNEILNQLKADLTQCSVFNVNLDPCRDGGSFCTIKRTKRYTLSVDFLPKFSAERLELSMYADEENNGEYKEVVKSPADACDMVTCPIEADERRIFDIEFTLGKTFSVGKYPVKVKIFNKENEKQGCCFTFNVKIKK